MSESANKADEIVKAYLRALEKRGVPLQKAYLFGSHSKGTAGPNSDIDLIVVSPAFSGMPQWKRWEILGDALAEIMEPIEVRGCSPDEIYNAKKLKASFIYDVLAEPHTIEYNI